MFLNEYLVIHMVVELEQENFPPETIPVGDLNHCQRNTTSPYLLQGCDNNIKKGIRMESGCIYAFMNLGLSQLAEFEIQLLECLWLGVYTQWNFRSP